LRNKSSILAIIVLLLISNLIAGCIEENESPPVNPVYITDDTGKNVSVPGNVDKIISLAPSVTEILFSLDLGDKIVGIDSGSNYPPETKDIEIVSTYEGVDIEKIISKEPDIIFMDKTLDLSETNYNQLLSYNLVVFRVYPTTLQDVLDDILLIGEVTKNELKANELVDDLTSRINNVKTRGDLISEPNRPTILHVFYFDGATSPWVGTSSTFSGDLIEIAGGDVAVNDNQGFSIQITVERMIELDPDIIFTSQDETWPTPTRESIVKDDTFKGLKAVKNDRIIDVNADLVDRSGPRLVDGLELFSQYITS
jgi:iron complex transport system substrate-binding protein